MGLFDRIIGGGSANERAARPAGTTIDGDAHALERYRYLLRTASPETIEQTHAEAFAKLTPEQRRQVLNELRNELPDGERETVLRAGETPAALARAATRAEVRQPGTLERTFGRVGGGAGGIGLGGLMAGTFLSTMAGAVIGTALAQHFIGSSTTGGEAASDSSADAGTDAGGYSDAGDAGGFDVGDGGFDV
ncbi:MAG TPA: hypothetical protein VNE58_01300 [Casimicrobiaceae bacterium]|nr:hypothetical protein [Casimicrobiaceae bacterium]